MKGSRILILLMMLFVSACAPLQISRVSKPNGNKALPSVSGQTNDAAAQFTLKTGTDNDKLVFIGVGGELEGQINPDLKVAVGTEVEITLINEDAVQHDITVPDLNAASERITEKGSRTTLQFTADTAGIFTYYCSLPGHRQAGMEGQLIVGDEIHSQPVEAPSIVRSPTDLPAPLERRDPTIVRVDLETIEVIGQLADGTSYAYWTFNGKVPGPLIRVRVGDQVEVHLNNFAGSTMIHSVDFHAATGPGGGAVASQTHPGEETSFRFKALHPGLYVYHCATPMVAHHIANGMYGLILVEPEEGLPLVDQEFYVMQGEIYTMGKINEKGETSFSLEKLLDENPEYFVFNGAVDALTNQHPLQAEVGETIRILFGVGGPNHISSFHVIGEVFDHVYNQASITSEPLTDVQTVLVPPGGAVVVDLRLEVPGRYILVDHALSRVERGLAGLLVVEGPGNHDVFRGPGGVDVKRDLANSKWELVSIGDSEAEKTIFKGSLVTLEFDANVQASGFGGCNSYRARYETPNETLVIDGFVSTLIACENKQIMEQEQYFFKALQEAMKYEVSGEHLVIWNADGTSRLTFIKIITETDPAH